MKKMLSLSIVSSLMLSQVSFASSLRESIDEGIRSTVQTLTTKSGASVCRSEVNDNINSGFVLSFIDIGSSIVVRGRINGNVRKLGEKDTEIVIAKQSLNNVRPEYRIARVAGSSVILLAGGVAVKGVQGTSLGAGMLSKAGISSTQLANLVGPTAAVSLQSILGKGSMAGAAGILASIGAETSGMVEAAGDISNPIHQLEVMDLESCVLSVSESSQLANKQVYHVKLVNRDDFRDSIRQLQELAKDLAKN